MIEHLAVNRKKVSIPISGKGNKSGLIAWHSNQLASEEELRRGENLLMSSCTWEHQEEETASLT